MYLVESDYLCANHKNKSKQSWLNAVKLISILYTCMYTLMIFQNGKNNTMYKWHNVSIYKTALCRCHSRLFEIISINEQNY